MLQGFFLLSPAKAIPVFPDSIEYYPQWKYCVTSFWISSG